MIYRNNCQLLQRYRCNVCKYKNLNCCHVIDVVTIQSSGKFVLDRPNVVIVVKLAILQRICQSKKRHQRRPQKVKPHIPYYYKTLPFLQSPSSSPQQQCSNVYDLFLIKCKTNLIVLIVHVNKAVLSCLSTSEDT